MLSYAFQVLKNKEYKKVETEDFEDATELFSEILIIALTKQIKQGLVRDYIDYTDTTSSIKGKINITESINSQSILKKRLNCVYDEFSLNCNLNQIIKSTLNILLKSDISKQRHKKLKRLMMYFNDVDLIDIKSINWQIRYDRNNQNYQMIIGICHLIINGFIQSKNEGKVKLMDFEDEQKMHKLYEKFILNYYKKEYPKLKVHSPQIKWELDDDYSHMLPKMQTDIVLSYEDKTLIIDAKYYGKNTQKYWNKQTINSSNLYQIFTYVKNKEESLRRENIPHEVSGMLLYAKTNQKTQPDEDYLMSGNKISVKTLNLNQDFNLIKEELNNIADTYFNLN